MNKKQTKKTVKCPACGWKVEKYSDKVILPHGTIGMHCDGKKVSR